MSAELTVIAIPHNGQRGKKPREPLVQLLVARYGEVTSIVFHPDHAGKVAREIIMAGRAAKANRARKSVSFKFGEE